MRFVEPLPARTYYSVISIDPDEAWDVLRGNIPAGAADSMNWCLLSMSGVHGSW